MYQVALVLFAVVPSILLFESTLTSQEILDVWNELINPYNTECMCACDVDPRLVYLMNTKLEYRIDACLFCYLKCIYQNINLMLLDGTIDRDEVYNKFPGASYEMIDTCLAKSQNMTDLLRKAYTFDYCLVTYVPFVL